MPEREASPKPPAPLDAGDAEAIRRVFDLALGGAPAIAEAVKSWQARLGVTADGIVGERTKAVFDALLPASLAHLRYSPAAERFEPEGEPEGPEGEVGTEWKPARLFRLSDRGLAFLKAHEGFRANWYRDPVGVLTIGYGHTGPLPPGYTAPLSEAEATDLMRTRVEREFGAAVRSGITAPITQGMYDAMTSLAYNIGVGGFGRSSVRRLTNAGDYRGAADAFKLWNKGGGRVLPGLVRRRAEEAAMYREGIR